MECSSHVFAGGDVSDREDKEDDAGGDENRIKHLAYSWRSERRD